MDQTGKTILRLRTELKEARKEIALMKPVVKAAIEHREPPFICTTMREAVRDYKKAKGIS